MEHSARSGHTARPPAATRPHTGRSEDPAAGAHGPIVCGVERTEERRAAPRLAADLAERLGTRLVLVLASPAPANATASMVSQMEILRERAVEHGRALLAEVAGELAQAGAGRAATEAVGRVEFGEPAPRLAAVADELGAELIVVGSRGRGPARSALLGSVSQTLAAQESCPVLVVPPGAGDHPHRSAALPGSIICGVDGSGHATKAARASGRLARSLGDRLVLVHVEEQGREMPPAELEFDAPLVADARPRLQVLRRAAKVAGAAQVEMCLAAGEPAEALEAVAARESAELVAVGTRGRGALRALALGSVSRTLVASSSRPVLVVNEPAAGRTGS